MVFEKLTYTYLKLSFVFTLLKKSNISTVTKTTNKRVYLNDVCKIFDYLNQLITLVFVHSDIKDFFLNKFL